MKKFVKYFNDEKHPDVVEYLDTKVSEDRRIEPYYLLKFLKEPPGNIYNRQTIAFRLILNCIEAYSCKRTKRRFLVTREGYSKASGLLQDIMYDKEHKHRDYWTILQQVKDLSLDQRYWFGIISDEKARRNLSRIQMSKGGVISYIVYGPRNNRGTWKILFKLPKDSNIFAKFATLHSRIFSSKDFSSHEFLLIKDIVKQEITKIRSEFCDTKLGDWSVPDEEQMKISFHTPGALCYLKESKTAYVKSNETPKDMMRRIKLESRTAKETQDRLKKEKDDNDSQRSIKEEESRRGDPEDLSKITVPDSNQPDISINE